jgi:hypothetical protein
MNTNDELARIWDLKVNAYPSYHPGIWLVWLRKLNWNIKKGKFLVPAKYKPGMPTTILIFSVNTITMLYVYYCLTSGEGQWGSACGKYLQWQSFVILIVSVIKCSSWWCLSRHQCEIWIKHTLIFPTSVTDSILPSVLSQADWSILYLVKAVPYFSTPHH